MYIAYAVSIMQMLIPNVKYERQLYAVKCRRTHPCLHEVSSLVELWFPQTPRSMGLPQASGLNTRSALTPYAVLRCRQKYVLMGFPETRFRFTKTRDQRWRPETLTFYRYKLAQLQMSLFHQSVIGHRFRQTRLPMFKHAMGTKRTV